MSIYAPVLPYTPRREAATSGRFWLLNLLDAWRAHQREALAIRPRCD